jgi:hypothetical protein
MNTTEQWIDRDRIHPRERDKQNERNVRMRRNDEEREGI